MKPKLELVAEGAAELLYPTRCVLCDLPGNLLCDGCRLEIPYIDRLKACKSCGQVYGRLACIDCNTFRVEHNGMQIALDTGEPILDQVASVFEFVSPCSRLVTVYKDRREIRMAKLLAEMLASYIDPSWIRTGKTALVVIPARKQALRERGFDHMKEIGKHLSETTQIPLFELLKLNERADQRGLSAKKRAENMQGSFEDGLSSLQPKALALMQLCYNTDQALPETVILVDDVLTTGATLLAAAKALKETGVQRVYGLTLGRVP